MYLLEHIMKMTGLNLAEIADELRINRTTLHSYYSKKRKMPIETIIQIAKTYKISWAKIGEFLENDFK